MADQDRASLLCRNSYEWVSCICRDQSTAELTCVPFFYQHVRHGFRHILVEKKMHALFRTSQAA